MKYLVAALLLAASTVAQAQTFQTQTSAVSASKPARASGFSSQYLQVLPSTVSGLPTCADNLTGARGVVSDALAPSYLQPLTGGGTATAGALCNGTSWVAD